MAIFIGNGAANLIAGSAGNDLIEGLGGNDTINAGSGDDFAIGGEGNDDLFGGSGNDGLAGEAGNDLITGGANNDQITGGADNDTLIGGGGNDLINGGGGEDLINGGGGNDTLIGGGGADSFQFNFPNEGVDTIQNFVSGVDTISIDNAGFGSGLNLGTLPAGQFVLGNVALDANDRFMYNSATGNLFFDPTGVGVADRVLLATLGAGTLLNASDIDIV